MLLKLGLVHVQLINREIIIIVWKLGQCIGDFSQQSGKQVFLQVKRVEEKKDGNSTRSAFL